MQMPKEILVNTMLRLQLYHGHQSGLAVRLSTDGMDKGIKLTKPTPMQKSSHQTFAAVILFAYNLRQ